MKSKIHRLTSVVLILISVLTVLSTASCGVFDGSDDNGGDNAPHLPVIDPIDDNYRTFYQIFVGSFSDSNGDGIGDLRGIINRIDYLNDGDISAGNDLGVQGIWLSPIFSSPTYHKYDAIDYYQVDSKFGTEEDLRELVELCNERNVKIILDLVINHTSSQNQWFLKFKEARRYGNTDNKYYDYYSCVRASEKETDVYYQQIYNVDWWYECNFSGEMPELNFDNPEVREEMLNLAKYYLDLGVDGFRFDAVKYIYYGNTSKSVDFWNWYMDELKEYKPDIYCVGECWSAESEVLQYYDAMNCFNFGTSGAEGIVANAAKGSKLSTLLNYIESYQDKIQKANSEAIAMPFLSNHDMDRIGGAFIFTDNMRMAANLYLLSPGSPFIYYGEEIGLRGSRGSAMTDANRRLAMLWGDGDTVKDPVGSTYSQSNQITTTVTSQLEDEESLLSAYREILAIRHKYPAIARGNYNAVTSSNTRFGGFYIEYNGIITGLFHNTSTEQLTVDLSKCSGLDGHEFSRICDVVGGEATLDGSLLTIDPQCSIILK